MVGMRGVEPLIKKFGLGYRVGDPHKHLATTNLSYIPVKKCIWWLSIPLLLAYQASTNADLLQMRGCFGRSRVN